MNVTGLSHITLLVRDAERSGALLESLLGAVEVYDSGGETFSLSREKFFLAGGVWLCLMEGEPLRERTYRHVAFQIQEGEFDAFAARVKEAGVEIRPDRPRVAGEGRSLYFYDYDGNLFELHTGTLRERLERYGKGKGAHEGAR